MTHPAELAELKPLLRSNLFLDLDEYTLLKTKQDGWVCRFLEMRLASAFQPIYRSNGKVFGREALLRASLFEHGALQANAAFDLAIDARELVLFDRLVRTLHLLNYAATFASEEFLFLNVHPRLLTSVNDHGRVFEQILHYYSVPTSRVVIEIKASAVEDETRLAEAVKNYRSLGYRVAVDDFGSTQSSIECWLNLHRLYENLLLNQDDVELNRVLALKPDFVKLDGAVIRAAEHNSNASRVIYDLVRVLHSIGAKVVIEGIENSKQQEIARNSGADLLQGFHLGRPEFANEAHAALLQTEQLAA
jgi:EAL domain-containing protein (putative c-di-GMP-specific phosphodiesterase class I)